MSGLDLGALAELIRSHRYSYVNEKELQAGIEQVLLAAKLVRGIDFQREVYLSATDIADFMVGGTVIEVKIGGSLSKETRQIHRYLQHPSVTGVLLVATRMRLTNLPNEMSGKPVRAVVLWESML
jgi:hypothetical protein